VRRRVEIGDALAPSIAALFVLLGGVLTVLSPGDDGMDATDWPAVLGFGAAMLALLVGSFVIMLLAGPLILGLVDSDAEYRLLRADFPWKYIGFILGGICAIAGTIALAERRFTWSALWVALLAVLAFILLFDLPFDDLLLPPNGDF